MQIRIEEKGKEDIAAIEPLWEKLNALHLQKSVHFKDKYRKWTFRDRMLSLQGKIENGKVKLDLLFDEDAQKYTGYCLSTIADGKGVVESIFIESAYRKHGFGGMLMQNALDWFSENGVSEIGADVAYDNREALPFYQRYGLFVSAYLLKRK